MIKNLLFPTLISLTIFFVPGVSAAFETTGQKAIRLDETTMLYMVQFEFTFLNRDVRIPIGAVRDLKYGSELPYIGYTLLGTGKTLSTLGTSYGVLLSEAQVLGKEYYVPRGKKAKFTLVTLVKLPADLKTIQEAQPELSVAITSLRIVLMEAGAESVYQHDVKSLEPYTTPSIKI
jgi:hypothetical protein